MTTPATQARDLVRDRAASVAPAGYRRMWVGGQRHDDAPGYDLDDVVPGVTGPAAVTSAYTTVILAPGETARSTPRGDLLVDLEG